MSVIFVDTTDVNANWQKEWESLSDKCTILKPAKLENLAKDPTQTLPKEASLIVIHESVSGRSDLVKSLGDSTFTHLCWMLVAGSPLDGSTSADGREHKSKIAFPGSPASLAFLKNRLEQLVASLMSIPRTAGSESAAELRKRAWEAWELVSDEVLPSLAVFCEGFLAAHANQLAQWKDAAKVMGLVGDDNAEAMTADVKREMAQHSSWFANPASWLGVFGSVNEMTMNVANELAGRRRKLEDQTGLSALLTAMGGQGNLVSGVVASAYLNIREIRRSS